MSQKRRRIGEVLDGIETATRTAYGKSDPVSVGDLIEELGPRSFAPLLLVPALLIVSPASAVPGVPTVLGATIVLIVGQAFFGRRSLWLPSVLSRRALPAYRLRAAIAFLRHPVTRIEPLLGARLTVLADAPAHRPALAVILATAVLMPVAEFIPFLTSFLAATIALIASGLFLRDGVLVLMGYLASAGGAFLLLSAARFLIPGS